MGYLQHDENGYIEYADDKYVRVVRPMYLAYITYKSMGGTLDELTFDEYEFQAETVVNWHTFNRLKKEDPKNYPDALEYCMYQLVKLIATKMQASVLPTDGEQTSGVSAAISSQSNDGVSISFNTLSAKDVVTSSDAEMKAIIERYLADVKDSLGHKLLYRGVYPNE